MTPGYYILLAHESALFWACKIKPVALSIRVAIAQGAYK